MATLETLGQALTRRAAGIAWRNAAREALASGRRFHFIPS